LTMRIRDNIVVQPPIGGPYWVIFNASGDCSATCNNLFGTNNLFFGQGAPLANLNITAGLNVDPLFVNAAGADFHLQTGSPAATAGAITPDLMDFDGLALPQGAGYPIGAYASSNPQSRFPLTSCQWWGRWHNPRESRRPCGSHSLAFRDHALHLH